MVKGLKQNSPITPNENQMYKINLPEICFLKGQSKVF